MVPIKKYLLGFVLFLVLPATLGVWLSIYNHRHASVPEDISATVLSEAKALPDFMLKDHHGQTFTKASLMGQWSFLFFGYTNCPDICPITLAVLNQSSEILQKTPDLEPPTTIFISVDPKRDNSAALADYVAYFNEEFIGVTGSQGELQNLTGPLGIAYGKEGDTQGTDYEVFHSSRVMLIDPHARLKALFAFPNEAQEIVSDYVKIVNL